MKKIENLINTISKNKDLTFEESKLIFLEIMSGKMNEDLIHKFLVDLAKKGETANEIAGGVYVLRKKALKVKTDNNIVDTCGTGGDGKNTLNISTASSLLLSSMGIKVAKHGNKALSSKCGSADVLEKLNININLGPEEVSKSIEINNFGFMFAPNYHSAMKFVGHIRKKIGKRTIFNLIGPLSSPANVKRQVVGVFSKKWLHPFASALKNLKTDHAWIVHSDDGMDEISPFAPTSVVELKKNEINEIKIDPIKLGIKANNPNNLLGKDPSYNAEKIIEIFSGVENEFTEAVSLNTAASLIVANKFKDFEASYNFSKKHIMSGNALNHLKKIQIL
ncbi:MAG TPA: anthranilate phosphoribosyltransferase [Candidatus Pelagibacter sp.]|jgi:anthranilate phosphoribosyltransferase|nr:anthranilate phosphoribosyltransferase [Candidatus Pelagibacter sp.]